jgi:hypothetical protein
VPGRKLCITYYKLTLNTECNTDVAVCDEEQDNNCEPVQTVKFLAVVLARPQKEKQ